MANTPESTTKNYLDKLRLISTLAVILLHISAEVCHRYFTIPTHQWLVANVIDSFTRFCVPVFIMISGALNLQQEKAFSIKKRMTTILLPFMFWTTAYLLWLHFTEGLALSRGIILIFQGPIYYHLWFVYVIAGLYLLTPIIKPIVAARERTEYLLLVWGIFSVALPFLGYFTGYKLYPNLNFLDGYIGLYILGFYLDKYFDIKVKKYLLIPLLIVAWIFTATATWVATYQTNTFDQTFMAYLTPNVVIMAIALFLLAKNSGTYSKLAEKSSRAGYHVYLGHALFLTILNTLLRANTGKIKLPIYPELVFKFVFVTVISYLVAFILLRIGKAGFWARVKTKSGLFIFLTIMIGFLAVSDKSALLASWRNLTNFRFPPVQEKTIDFSKQINGIGVDVLRQDLRFINTKDQIVRFAIPVPALGNFEPKDQCQFYIPNYKTHETKTSYKTFDQLDWNNDFFGITKTDTYGQLVCKNAEEIRIKILDVGVIYIFKI